MKPTRIWSSAAIVLAAMAGLNLSEARAGSITQILSIGQTATPINHTFSFDAYNGPAGTLLGVTLTVEETINGVVQVINVTNINQLVDSATIAAPVTATSVAGTTNTNATASIMNETVAPGLTSFPSLSGVDTQSSTYSGAAVNPFYGPTTTDVTVTSATGTVTGTPIGVLFYGGSVTAAVKVTLVYNFTGPLVPEPTSSAMFGIGIVLAAGYGWGRGRRRLTVSNTR